MFDFECFCILLSGRLTINLIFLIEIDSRTVFHRPPTMKFSFLIILFLSLNVCAQQVDIVLIGVSHNYSNYPRQDLSAIYGKIRKFAPTAFFGEFLSKEDERLVMDYWCKKDNIRRLEILRKNRDIAVDLLPNNLF